MRDPDSDSHIENKQYQPGPDTDEADTDGEAEVPGPQPGQPVPGVTVDAMPGQYPPPGSFAATGTTSPNNDDPSWYSAERASWDPSAPPPPQSQ